MFKDDYKDMINNIKIDKSEQDETLKYIFRVGEGMCIFGLQQ